MGTDSTESHDGAYYRGHIHFDPSALAAAANGDPAAMREIAITALHEGAHYGGSFHYIDPTWDSQGRDRYSEAPFDRLNPGPNSCVPR